MLLVFYLLDPTTYVKVSFLLVANDSTLILYLTYSSLYNTGQHNIYTYLYT